MSWKRIPRRPGCRFKAGIRSLVVASALWSGASPLPSLSAQESRVPYDQIYGPLFSLKPSTYSYPDEYRSIRDVDFKNLAVTFWEDDKVKPLLFHIRGGKCDIDYHPGHTSVQLAGVHYLDSAEGSRESVLAVYEEDDVGGSSNQEGVAQVFELANNHLRVAQELEWDLHYGGPFGPLDTFNDSTNSLEIHSSHYQPGDGHCCVSAVDVVIFRRAERRLVQASLRTELTGYGRTAQTARPLSPGGLRRGVPTCL